MRTTEEWTSTPIEFEESPRHRTGGNPRRGLPRACPLEDVTRIGEAELEDPGEVGVAGADPRDPLGPEPARLHLHRTLPVLPVAVLDDQRHRRAQRLATAHAADDSGGVVLDLLALAAPVTALAPVQVRIDGSPGVERQSRRDALDDDGELRAVRFAGGEEAKHLANDCMGGRAAVPLQAAARR